jgi:Fis family transcriptional regulator, factor for inversion stimulation protein
MKPRSAESLASSVEEAVKGYLNTMADEQVTELYDLVLSEVEVPLIECVLQFTNNNQSQTANILGLNRGTLRKKLRKYGLL